MHDLVIRNGRVVDGAETPAFLADIAIDNGKITAVGKITQPGRREIDAGGLIPFARKLVLQAKGRS